MATMALNINPSALAFTSTLHQTLSTPFHWLSANPTNQNDDLAPRLPLELCEAVIDHCRYDLRTLHACSLACRAWVGCAQTHIFRQTRLPTSRLHSVHSLLTANPALATYVQHLTIDFGRADTLADVRDVLKRVCQQMQSVHTLELTGISQHASLELNLLRTVLPKWATHLELGRITVAPQAPLPELIASFPLLQSLSLGDNLTSAYKASTWEAAGPITARLRAPLRTLHLSLTFSNPALLSYAQWLATGPHTLDLRTLSIAFVSPGTRTSAPTLLGLLLEKLCPPLETLELVMARDTDLSIVPFTLERATRLAHLRLLVRYNGSWTQDSPSAVRNWVVTLLSRVYLQSIHTIHLEIEDPGEEGYLFFDWVDDLIHTLLQSVELSTERITFESVGSCLASPDMACLEKKLDILRQKTAFEHVLRP